MNNASITSSSAEFSSAWLRHIQVPGEGLKLFKPHLIGDSMTSEYSQNIILKLMLVYAEEVQLRYINTSTCHWVILSLIFK